MEPLFLLFGLAYAALGLFLVLGARQGPRDWR